MSFSVDIVEVKKLFEDKKFFRGASPAQITNREDAKRARLRFSKEDIENIKKVMNTGYEIIDEIRVEDGSEAVENTKDEELAKLISDRSGIPVEFTNKVFFAINDMRDELDDIGNAEEIFDNDTWTKMVVKHCTGVSESVSEDKKFFRGASKSQLQTRETETQAREQQENAKRLAEVGEPLRRIMAIAPDIVNLLEQYAKNPFMGNYSETGRLDLPIRVSFNIKIYKIRVPDWAEDKLDTQGFWGESVDAFHWRMGSRLAQFVGDLQEEYPCIYKWFQSGRSGGWLVLELNSLDHEEEVCGIVWRFSQSIGDAIKYTEDWSLSEIEDTYKMFLTFREELSKRIEDLHAIGQKVERVKKEVTELLSSDAYWKDFFKRYPVEEEGEA